MDDKKGSLGKQAAFTANVFTAAARTVMLLGAKNCGHNHAGNNLTMLWSLGIICVFWMYHEAMVFVLCAAIFAEIYHRARPGKGVGSWYIGDPLLKNWKGTGALVAVAGFFLFEHAPPVGAWLCLSGLGIISTVGMAERRAKLIDDDLQDSMLESQARARRIQQLQGYEED